MGRKANEPLVNITHVGASSFDIPWDDAPRPIPQYRISPVAHCFSSLCFMSQPPSAICCVTTLECVSDSRVVSPVSFL